MEEQPLDILKHSFFYLYPIFFLSLLNLLLFSFHLSPIFGVTFNKSSVKAYFALEMKLFYKFLNIPGYHRITADKKPYINKTSVV